MRTLILINESTLKKNPTAGNTSALVPGLESKVEDEKGNITIIRPAQRLRFMQPEGKYLYSLGRVKCIECGWEGDFDDLTADAVPGVIMDDGTWSDEVWSNEICPKCGKWDCLGGFTVETVEECLKRIGKTEKDIGD